MTYQGRAAFWGANSRQGPDFGVKIEVFGVKFGADSKFWGHFLWKKYIFKSIFRKVLSFGNQLLRPLSKTY